MNRITTYIIVIIVIGASIGGVYALDRYYFREDNDVEEPELVVEEGDIVTVHYVGWLEDERIYDGRRVFDSSRDVDQDTIITFTERARGEPFQFTVDREEVIDGWVENVVGMREGQTKTFTIPPEKAYPGWSEDLIYEFNKVEALPVYEEMEKTTFIERYEEEPSPNMVVTDIFWNWDKTVLSVHGDMVQLMHEPEVGEKYTSYIHRSTDWTTEVLSIDSSEDVIEVRHQVDKPTIIDASYMDLHPNIEGFGDEVSQLRHGTNQNPEDSRGIVVDTSDDTITIDFNDEVNNKELTFRMEVLEIQKGVETPGTP